MEEHLKKRKRIRIPFTELPYDCMFEISNYFQKPSEAFNLMLTCSMIYTYFKSQSFRGCQNLPFILRNLYVPGNFPQLRLRDHGYVSYLKYKCKSKRSRSRFRRRRDSPFPHQERKKKEITETKLKKILAKFNNLRHLAITRKLGCRLNFRFSVVLKSCPPLLKRFDAMQSNVEIVTFFPTMEYLQVLNVKQLSVYVADCGARFPRLKTLRLEEGKYKVDNGAFENGIDGVEEKGECFPRLEKLELLGPCCPKLMMLCQNVREVYIGDEYVSQSRLNRNQRSLPRKTQSRECALAVFTRFENLRDLKISLKKELLECLSVKNVVGIERLALRNTKLGSYLELSLDKWNCFESLPKFFSSPMVKKLKELDIDGRKTLWNAVSFETSKESGGSSPFVQLLRRRNLISNNLDRQSAISGFSFFSRMIKKHCSGSTKLRYCCNKFSKIEDGVLDKFENLEFLKCPNCRTCVHCHEMMFLSETRCDICRDYCCKFCFADICECSERLKVCVPCAHNVTLSCEICMYEGCTTCRVPCKGCNRGVCRISEYAPSPKCLGSCVYCHKNKENLCVDCYPRCKTCNEWNCCRMSTCRRCDERFCLDPREKCAGYCSSKKCKKNLNDLGMMPICKECFDFEKNRCEICSNEVCMECLTNCDLCKRSICFDCIDQNGDQKMTKMTSCAECLGIESVDFKSFDGKNSECYFNIEF